MCQAFSGNSDPVCSLLFFVKEPRNSDLLATLSSCVASTLSRVTYDDRFADDSIRRGALNFLSDFQLLENSQIRARKSSFMSNGKNFFPDCWSVEHCFCLHSSVACVVARFFSRLGCEKEQQRYAMVCTVFFWNYLVSLQFAKFTVRNRGGWDTCSVQKKKKWQNMRNSICCEVVPMGTDRCNSHLLRFQV